MKIGTEEALSEGVRIIASHIDSPRLDIKQNPLYEDEGMAFLKTHYYGGIKKYQWTAIPLALHGVVSTSDGRNVSVVVGENDDDPIFTSTTFFRTFPRSRTSNRSQPQSTAKP